MPAPFMGHHGRPWTLLVVDPNPKQLEQLLALFPEADFYLSIDAAREALDRRTQFNVIEIASGWKVALIIPKRTPFSRSELERRRPRDFNGVSVNVATAEDTIIAKLDWSKAGGSERQLEDVASILRLRRSSLDLEYIKRWVQALGLDPQWDRAQALAGSE